MRTNTFTTKGMLVSVYKDDDFAEKGWAYEVRRKSDGEFIDAGHTYDHDRDASIDFASETASYEAKKEANAYKAEFIESIHDLLVEADVEDLSFVYHPNKQTFWKDGIQYEIFGITRNGGDPLISLDVKPKCEWKLDHFNLDIFWSRATLARIEKFVKDYLYKQGLL